MNYINFLFLPSMPAKHITLVVAYEWTGKWGDF